MPRGSLCATAQPQSHLDSSSLCTAEKGALIVDACARRLGSRAGPRTGNEERGFLEGSREVKGVKGV